MNYAPICLISLNRFEHFKRCVESLQQCIFADKSELIIGLDYPLNINQFEGWNKIKAYIPNITGFKTVTLFEHKENLGPTLNYASIRDYAFEKYDRIIFTEDDNIFSPHFLRYMNETLEIYENDPTVWGIFSSITSFQSKLNYSKTNVIKIKGYYNEYGSGIWKEKYYERANSIQNGYREYICSNRKHLFKFLNYTSLFHDFIFWVDSNMDLEKPCDLTYSVSSVVNDKYYIVSTLPMTINMGYDGNGMLCDKNELRGYSADYIFSDDKYELLTSEEDQYREYVSKAFSNRRKKDLSFFTTLGTRILILLYAIFRYDEVEAWRKKIVHFIMNVRKKGRGV